MTGPSADQVSFSVAGQPGAISRFPEIREFIPAVAIPASDPLPPPMTEEELVAATAAAGGKVFIGIKPPGAPRTRESRVVPAIDRATALAGRADVQTLGAEIIGTYRNSSTVVARISPNLAPVLLTHPAVNFVEPIFPGRLMQAPPEDTSWGVKKIGAHEVWAGIHGPAMRGQFANITIIDGGLDSLHRWEWWGDGPENLFLDCYYFGPETGPSCYDDHIHLDDRGHGVHVAGIIAGRDNEFGWIGIANNPARFASIKACKDGDCHPDLVVAALDWVLSSGRPRHIVNMSLGWCRNYTEVAQKVAALSNAGILLIGSAGNRHETGNYPCGPDHDLGTEVQTGVVWPARYSQVMAVSGTLEDDSFASAPPGSGGSDPPGGGSTPPPCEEDPNWFLRPECQCEPECPPQGGHCHHGSRYGSQVDIAAPFSAYSMNHSGGYRFRCGTSMSAPAVAAVAALVWSMNPSWTHGEVRQHLKYTAVPYSPSSQFGAGRVNAVQAVYGSPPPPPPQPPPCGPGKMC